MEPFLFEDGIKSFSNRNRGRRGGRTTAKNKNDDYADRDDKRKREERTTRGEREQLHLTGLPAWGSWTGSS